MEKWKAATAAQALQSVDYVRTALSQPGGSGVEWLLGEGPVP